MFKKHWPLFVIICIALITRIVMIKLPISPWWDPAIYVGMGKFMFSHGTIGMWETLRPPLWPILLGITWFGGLNPLFMAKVFAALAGIGAMIVLYFIGEKEHKGLGSVSALMLALSPSFAFFVAIPTNDIAASFLVLIASFYILRKKYFLAGLMISLAFLMRFPNGLFLLPFSLFILIENWSLISWSDFFKKSIRQGINLILGFCTIAIPYFIINYIFFQDAFLPLKEGRSVIEGSSQESVFYYVKYILLDTPVVILAAFGVVMLGYELFRRRKISAVYSLSLLCALIVGVYFSHIGHKELRYSFIFLPFIIIIASYGLSRLWQLFNPKYAASITFVVILIIGGVNLWIQATHQYIIALSPQRNAYYEFIPKEATAITSSPQIMLGSDVKIVGVFDAAEKGTELIENNDGTFQYIAIDSCQLSCWQDSCDEPKQTFVEALELHTTKVYEASEQKCTLSIYKVK